MKRIIGLLLAAACFAGGLGKTTAQETLTIEYSLEGTEDVRHELQVEKDVEVLKFEDPPLASLTLPEGLTKLRELEVDFPYSPPLYGPTSLTLPEDLISLEELTLWQCRLSNLTLPKGLVRLRSVKLTDWHPSRLSLKLPEDLGRNASRQIRVFLSTGTTLERLSVHINMKEFHLNRHFHRKTDALDFPHARELIRNRKPDSDGVFRIQDRPRTISGARIVVCSDGIYRIEARLPFLVDVYGFQPTITITRKADGVEIGWEAGILQRSLLIDGPWRDVESGGTERRIFLRPSHPYEFFRIKP